MSDDTTMRVITPLAAMLVATTLPSAVAAQHDMSPEAKHEIGVDLSTAYQHLGAVTSGATTTPSSSQVLVGTPVDVRIGFPASDRLVSDPRLAFALQSKGNSTGGTAYVFDPLDLNLLLAFRSNRTGPYVTAGAALRVVHDTSTLTQFGFNGGIGTRLPYEAGAIRLEAFGQYFLRREGDGTPDELNVGVRVGLSLWH